MGRTIKIYKLFVAVLLLVMTGCAYYNTLFNALKLYNTANKKLVNRKTIEITADIRKDYNDTIDKCWKLINLYSDSSKYADDAFLLIAKSHYQMEEYTNAERYLTQFLGRYPKSKLIPEATLWLAKSLIKLDKPDQASEYLNSLIAENRDQNINAQAYYYLAEIFLRQKNYEPTLNNLRNCIEVSDDDYLSASAQVIIGDIYFEEKDYAKAIENYNLVNDYSASLKIDFDAQSKKVSTLLLTENYVQAYETLNALLNQSRFVDYYAYFEARLGECLTLQQKFDLAAEKFNTVLEKYPRSEGSGIAAFRLAQLLESHYANPDSAQKMYLRVEKEDRNSVYKSEAVKQAQLLQTYLKIKESIGKDLADWLSISSADSSRVPSMVDSSATAATEDSAVSAVDTSSAATPPSKSGQNEKKDGTVKPGRSLAQIKSSLDKNRFALAEFFLLNIQYYDSARVAYNNFIATSDDSSLIAKAYYALYYIAAFNQEDTTAAQNYKGIILSEFPSSVYADYLRIKVETVTPHDTATTDTIKSDYLYAESLLFAAKYDQAIEKYNQIAARDSGTIWAEKARYAVAWIYEQKLGDIPRAIEAYTKIAQEYPNSVIGQIAKNKIKKPVETIEPGKEIPVTTDSSSVQQPPKMTVPAATLDSSRTSPVESAADTLR